MNHKKSGIGLFFERMRMKLFDALRTFEIYNCIAPQIHQEKEYGYPFHSEAELVAEMQRIKLELMRQIQTIEQQAEHMGKAYGEAFRYVMYRELNERIRLYFTMGQRRVPPKLRAPLFA